MESTTSSHPGGRQFLLQKVETRFQGLGQEADCVVAEITRIESFVNETLGESKNITLSMKTGEKSFRECSSSLQNFDDCFAILHSMISQVDSWRDLQSDNPDSEQVNARSSNFLVDKIMKKASEVVKSGEAVLAEAAALQVHLGQLQGGLAGWHSSWDTCSQEQLVRGYCSLSSELSTREVQLVGVWQALAGWEVVREVRGPITGFSAFLSERTVDTEGNTILELISKPSEALKVEENANISSEETTEQCSDCVGNMEEIRTSTRVNKIIRPLVNLKPVQSPDATVEADVKCLSSSQSYTLDPRQIKTDPAAEVSTEDITLMHKKKLMDKMVRKFSVWGQPLSAETEYPGRRVSYEEGDPAAFWLNFNTEARDRFQVQLNKSHAGSESCCMEPGQLSVGQCVVARYREDGRLYRARLLEVASDSKVPWAATVRYIDYGNLEKRVRSCDIFPWDPLLADLQPQAILCCLQGAPDTLAKENFSREQLDSFYDIMLSEGPFRMTVNCCLQPSGRMFQAGCNISFPEVAVSLLTKHSKDLLDTLAKNTVLASLFPSRKPKLEPLFSNIQLSEKDPVVPMAAPKTMADSQEGTAAVPPPFHLEGEEMERKWLPACTSHPPEARISQAVVNVNWWFENKWQEETQEEGEKSLDCDEQSPELSHGSKKSKVIKPEFPNQMSKFLSQSQEEVHAETQDKNKASNTVEEVSPPSMACILEKRSTDWEVKDDSFDSFSDLKEPQKASSSFKPPISITPPDVNLNQQLPSLLDGEFQWMPAHIHSPGELWVQPLQDQTARLHEVEESLASQLHEDMHCSLATVSPVAVEIESCWALRTSAATLAPIICCCPWLRVRVEAVDGEQVMVRSLDYGSLATVSPTSLISLPLGPASSLPGLAVRCHLSNITARGEEWDKEAMDKVSELLDWSRVYTALVQEESHGQLDSLGLVVLLEPGVRGNTCTSLNLKMVELGHAVSEVFGEEELGDVTVEQKQVCEAFGAVSVQD